METARTTRPRAAPVNPLVLSLPELPVHARQSQKMSFHKTQLCGEGVLSSFYRRGHRSLKGYGSWLRLRGERAGGGPDGF